MEIYKDVIGWETDYQVSNFGNVRSIDKIIIKNNGSTYNRIGKILKPGIQSKGYKNVVFSRVGKFYQQKVHRLVGINFIDNPENKPQINHIDGNPSNNNVDNLEWATASENISHAYRIGLAYIKSGEKNGMHKLTQTQVDEIRNIAQIRGKHYGRKELAIYYNVSEGTIKEIITRRRNRWANL